MKGGKLSKNAIIITSIVIIIIIILLIAGIIIFIAYKSTSYKLPTTQPSCILPSGTGYGGSWQSSCTGGTMNGSVLSASCKSSTNNSNNTSLDLTKCTVGDILNDNGTLKCEKTYQPGDTPFCNSQIGCVIPYTNDATGSLHPYVNKCTNPSISDTVLSATCKISPNSSATVDTTLDLSKCGEGNIDVDGSGNLFCAPGAGFC